MNQLLIRFSDYIEIYKGAKSIILTLQEMEHIKGLEKRVVWCGPTEKYPFYIANRKGKLSTKVKRLLWRLKYIT